MLPACVSVLSLLIKTSFSSFVFKNIHSLIHCILVTLYGYIEWGKHQSHFNTLRLRQNGRHLPDDIFKCIFLNENV